MPDSWRNILERAASNLSIELDRDAGGGFRQQPASWPAPKRPAPKSRGLAESRELLARELEAISGGTPQCRPGRAVTRVKRSEHPVSRPRPPLTQAIALSRPEVTPRRPIQRRRGSSLATLVALAVSVSVVVLTTYAFVTLMS